MEGSALVDVQTVDLEEGRVEHADRSSVDAGTVEGSLVAAIGEHAGVVGRVGCNESFAGEGGLGLYNDVLEDKEGVGRE